MGIDFEEKCKNVKNVWVWKNEKIVDILRNRWTFKKYLDELSTFQRVEKYVVNILELGLGWGSGLGFGFGVGFGVWVGVWVWGWVWGLGRGVGVWVEGLANA